jgi:hypothetical protein
MTRKKQKSQRRSRKTAAELADKLKCAVPLTSLVDPTGGLRELGGTARPVPFVPDPLRYPSPFVPDPQ